MITETPKRILKYKSEKEVVKQLYSKFNSKILSLIKQNGNLYEVILTNSANFEEVETFVSDYKRIQEEMYRNNPLRNSFAMIWLMQVGNDKKQVISIGAKHLYYQISGKDYFLVQLSGSQEINVYQDFRYEEVLRKYKGQWFMYGYPELAAVLGEILEKDEKFEKMNFAVQDYKKYGEE
ncbi:hypothetical protein D3C87_719920 [compost metagenome]